MECFTSFFIGFLLLFNSFTSSNVEDKVHYGQFDHMVVDSLLSYNCLKVIVQLPDTGSVPLPIDIFIGAVSNPSECDLEGLQFSFCSYDMNDSILTLGCYDLGINEHYTYMWLDGVKVDSCLQEVMLSDPTNVCEDCNGSLDDIDFECRGQLIELNDSINVAFSSNDFIGNVIFPSGCLPMEYLVSFSATNPIQDSIEFGCDQVTGSTVTLYFWLRKTLIDSCIADVLVSDPMGLCDMVLADEFLSFTTEVRSNSVHLSWETKFDDEYDFVSIEHKTEVGHFIELARLSKHQDLNNNKYNFNHIDPIAGVNYYRLQFLDESSGHLKYSNMEAVFWNPNEHSFEIYPNPVKSGFLHIQTKVTVNNQFQVFNRIGKELLNSGITDETKAIDVSDWVKGIYYIKIENEVQSFIIE